MKHPVSKVRWVPIEDVEPNDYNPNSVAEVEMQLLLRSILADGFTQPIVTVFNPLTNKYEIVDGFHRYSVALQSPVLLEMTRGKVPIVTLDKSIEERMASTIRHNRARGKHSIKGMSNLVFKMLEQGMTDAEVCNELGMEPEELLRLKHITGFAKLFETTQYREAWEGRNQIRVRKKYEATRADA